MKLDTAIQSLLDGLGRPQKLVLWYHHHTNGGNDEDAQPLAPGAQGALLGDGHDQTDIIGEGAPNSQGADGAINAHYAEDGVICVHMDCVQSLLRADMYTVHMNTV
eukprot:7391661-Prymnesium_polylepis.3